MADTAPMGKDEAIDLLRDALEHYQRLAPNTITAPEALRLTAHLAPSTAPEVDDPTKRTGRQFMDQWNAGAKEVAERQAFEGHERGSNLRRVGEGQYENPCVQSAWEGWQARAALASRPAEVDDEGLPDLPEETILGTSRYGSIFKGYTAEQYRQGQRDAVAAYKKKQAALQELADQAQENDMGYGDAVAADRARRGDDGSLLQADAQRYRYLRDVLKADVDLPHFNGAIEDDEVDEAMFNHEQRTK